jgi:hypothetical protein
MDINVKYLNMCTVHSLMDGLQVDYIKLKTLFYKTPEVTCGHAEEPQMPGCSSASKLEVVLITLMCVTVCAGNRWMACGILIRVKNICSCRD